MASPSRLQIQQALELEKQFEDGDTQYEQITQLALIYRQFIEYYDLNNNPMKQYFIEKMKRLMQSPCTMQTLIVSAPSTRRNSPTGQENLKHYYQNYQYETMKNQTITPRGIKQLQNDFLYQKENIEKIINNDYAKQLQQVTEKLQQRKQKKNPSRKSPSRTFTKIYKPPTLDMLDL
ncbi:unnamed protein product [Paramecium octaurelia]|uniref:Uncharacterized protein n=1 Tax=Paramecium octaurelia TaxID=43137 RepID=A0A8S1YFY0_PAROT|nr:unnamed protein product [Paramecium octaurelia]